MAEDPASLHDVHGPWEHEGLREQHELANATTSLLHSEFGVEGMTNLPTLTATVTEPHRRPLDRSNPVMAHRVPEESREFRVSWCGVGIEQRSIRLSGWNIEARVLTHG